MVLKEIKWMRILMIPNKTGSNLEISEEGFIKFSNNHN